jgi:hypothetical protein
MSVITSAAGRTPVTKADALAVHKRGLATFFFSVFGVGAIGHLLQLEYGRQTTAVVVDARCDPHTSDVCTQQCRLSAVATGHDLGWVRCDDSTPRGVGASVGVHVDSGGWFGTVLAQAGDPDGAAPLSPSGVRHLHSCGTAAVASRRSLQVSGLIC